MKKTILILVIIITGLITAGRVNSQWVQQYTGTTANLYDIEFLNRYTGWCVGTGSTCLKTTNGGINWIQMNHPIPWKPINSVHIVDSNIVYFVGDFETIFKTIDGGTNWIVIKNGPGGQGHSYEGLFFMNKDTGWICGTGSLVFKTTNGGISFDSVNISAAYVYDMYFKDANTGCVTTDGRIFRTTNGGLNWYLAFDTYWSTTFLKISFVENSYGWIAGYNDNAIYRTIDFGENWLLVSTYVSGMFGVCFVNKDTGFIGGLTNWLFKTTNGGYNWIRENTNIANHAFESIEFVDDTVGWACCTGGYILHTTTGGQSLTNIANQLELTSEEYALYQNYPNPFNNKTRIVFEIPKSSRVEIAIYDISGRKIDLLTDGIYAPGKYEIYYPAEKLNSGIYFYRMIINDERTVTKKLILIK